VRQGDRHDLGGVEVWRCARAATWSSQTSPEDFARAVVSLCKDGGSKGGN